MIKKTISLMLGALVVISTGCSREEEVTSKRAMTAMELTAEAERTVTDEQGDVYTMEVTAKEQEQLQEELKKTAELYQEFYKQADKGEAYNAVLSNKDIEHIVELLGKEGYIAGTTQIGSNLENAERAERYFDKAQRGEEDQISIYKVDKAGGLTRIDLHAKNSKIDVTAAAVGWNAQMEPEIMCINRYRAYSWQYTQKGYFIYERYEVGDNKRKDYSIIRIKPLNEVCIACMEKYLEPIGYQGNNLLLIDWDEQHLENIDFNDLFEYIYKLDTGEYMNAEEYAEGIPKQEFEPLMGKYFNVSAEWLQQHAWYDVENGVYAWQTLNCANYTAKLAGVPNTEVTKVIRHEDGTLTLIVDAVWEEMGTDCAYTHEVTVKPNSDGSFRYISNKIIASDDNQIPAYQHRNSIGYNK